LSPHCRAFAAPDVVQEKRKKLSDKKRRVAERDKLNKKR
jgi:hypothetical protein